MVILLMDLELHKIKPGHTWPGPGMAWIINTATTTVKHSITHGLMRFAPEIAFTAEAQRALRKSIGVFFSASSAPLR
jgi:hypothetical protein